MPLHRIASFYSSRAGRAVKEPNSREKYGNERHESIKIRALVLPANREYLRRKYASDLERLKAVAHFVCGGARSRSRATSHEGTSSSGQIAFEQLEYIGAVEDLISGMDPTGGAAWAAHDLLEFLEPLRETRKL
jgi:hypothetical protein